MAVPDAVVDRAALVELLARFTRCVDDPGAGDPRAFCTADVELVATRARGRGATDAAGVAEFLRGGTGERTQHLATDVVVDLDGDRAAVTANLLSCAYLPGRPLHRMAGLRCDLTAVRTAPGWRFARVALTRQWSHHPLPAQT